MKWGGVSHTLGCEELAMPRTFPLLATEKAMTHPTTENLQAMSALLAGVLHALYQGNADDAIPAVEECIERLEAMGISGVRDEENINIELDDISHINEQEVTAHDPAEVSADWDGEDWNFRGALVKKHWGMNSTCFSPSELGCSYSVAASLTPNQAIAIFMDWIDESLQHPQGETK